MNGWSGWGVVNKAIVKNLLGDFSLELNQLRENIYDISRPTKQWKKD